MRIKYPAIVWLVVIAAVICGRSTQARSSNNAGQVFIFPENKLVQLGETFDLYIAVDAQVKYFKSFEIFNIEVDTNVIRLISAAREPFFTGPMGVFFFWKDTVHTFPSFGPRYVYEMVGSILGYETYVDGPGQVVRMTFRAVGNGISGVIFRNVEMLNWHDSTMSIQDSLNGLVVVCPMNNQPPVANAGRDSTLSQTTPTPISFAADCSDPDNNLNLSACELISDIGTYNGSSITFTPTVSGTYTFILKATDICGLTDFDTSVVNVTLPSYRCGDSNGDGNINVSDAVHLIAYIFAGGTAPNPLLAGDANCSGAINISDAVYLIAYIFSGGPPPCGPCL